MATRSRRQSHHGHMIHPDLPIHYLCTLLSQDADAKASVCYSFKPHIAKLTSYPKKIDILHLLHDIYALNPFSNPDDQCIFHQIRNEIGNTKLLLEDDLAAFVTFVVRRITSRFYYGANDVKHHNTDTPNWMLLLYHNNLSTIDSKLSVISPILSLFDVATFYEMDHSPDIIRLISSLIIIRRHVPSSPLKGIDYQLLNDNYYPHDDEYIAIDHRHLFGEHLSHYLFHDLCKYIVTFLDLKSFFKCSMINSAWLHFIYHSDTFALIYKQIVSGKNRFDCQLLDHSILSPVHVPNSNAPLTIGWSLRCHNNSYLDFVTLKNQWFQSYVDMISITLQRKTRRTNRKQTEWIDVKQRNKCCSEVGFDALIMNDDEFEMENNTEYRMKLEMIQPFKSRPIYSNSTKLSPQQWLLRYTESKEKDDIDDAHDMNHNRKLVNVHVFWFSFYVDLLHSMNTNVISDVLKNLRICQNRIRANTHFLTKQYTPYLFKTIIRYLLHEDNKIKLNAMRCLRRIAIQETNELQHYYLTALAKHGLIRICEETLFRIRCSDNNLLCSLREEMLWFLGYFIKTGCEWKSVLLSEMTNVDSFIEFVVEEIEMNRKPKYTASYIWMLSKFFSLYHETRGDDGACGNHHILNVHLGRIMMKLTWKSFSNAFAKYKSLQLEQCALGRRQMEQDEDEEGKREEVERRQTLDGWRCVVRDSYYGYSMILKYFNKEILDIVDANMLKDIVDGLDGFAIDGMNGSEFALRMVRTSLSCCIDTVCRLVKYTKEIFDYGYLDKLYAILHAMIAKLEFLIMIKEKKIEYDMTTMDHFEDNGTAKAKEDEFMMLFPAILEAIPLIANNVGAAQSKITKLLYLIVDVAVLHADYLNVSDFSSESDEVSMIRDEDEICCTMAVLWDVMSRYGKPIRDYITENHKIMELIEYKWAAHHNPITANQAQSLLTALQNDHVFAALFEQEANYLKHAFVAANNDDINSHFVVFCPCGDPLKAKEAKDCYQTTSYCYLYCDYCRAKIDWELNPKRIVFHCDKNENIHPHGFDLCENCSKRKYFLDQ